jgi:hypothetical protein
MDSQCIAPEDIKASEIVLLECVQDMPSRVKNLPFWKPFMKKGWKTWTSSEAFYEQEDGILIIEDNFYEINFPAEAFKPISQFHLI